VSQQPANFKEVFSRLAEENLLDSGWEPKVRELLVREHNEQPWYVRVMVGFSAWLASWMFIGFIVGAAIVESSQATLILGVVLVVGAVVGRCISDNDFITQMALAVSLAGEALIVFGVGRITNSVELTLFSFIGLEAVLVAFYPDVVHRFLSAATIVMAFAGLLFAWDALGWVHVIVIGFAVVFVALVLSEKNFLARGQARLIMPVKWGVLFGQLSVLLLSTVYVLPELMMDEVKFFPRPWVSGVGLGLLFLYLVYHALKSEVFPLASNTTAVIYAVCVAALAVSAMSPGLIMAMIILLLGFINADRVLIGVATGFFTVFLAAFFYAIEMTLLMKSIVFITAGFVLLAGRWGLKFHLAAQKEMASNG